MNSAPRRVPTLPQAAFWLIAVELAVIVIAAVWALSDDLNFDPTQRLRGIEYEYLTSSAFTVAQAWREHGYIPMWQPYFSYGEPLIEWGFSSVLSPFVTVPAIVFGAINGIKVSLLIHVIIGGIGGWVLGRVLGLGWIGRVLLGLLMIGRGNLAGLMSEGFFQLTVSQAFMPYALAAAFTLVRFPDQRYPIILMGTAFALQLFTGNVYYVLPTGLIVASVMAVYALTLTRTDEGRLRLTVDRRLMMRFGAAVGFAVLLSAAVVIPLVIHDRYVAGHVPLTQRQWAAWRRDLWQIFTQFFAGTRDRYTGVMSTPQDYHAYVLPAWFALAIFVLLPPIRRLHRDSFENSRRFWVIALFWIVFFILWAVALNPIIIILSETILPLIGRWRYPGRMIAPAAFLIAVLAAVRVDALWRAVVRGTAIRSRLIAVVITGAAAVASVDVIAAGWKQFGGTQLYQEWFVDECIDAIQAAYPDRHLNIAHLYYSDVYTYVERHARLTLIGTRITPRPITPTLYAPLLLADVQADFAMAFDAEERAWAESFGYQPIPETVLGGETFPCGYVNPSALSYAFTIPLDALADQAPNIPELSAEHVTAIQPLSRIYDHVTFGVNADPVQPLVVVAREVAYPGWQVEIDGTPAQLESVGGLIGVVVPPDDGQAKFIHFYYRPPLLIASMIVTVLSGFAGIAILLRLDQRLLLRFRRSE